MAEKKIFKSEDQKINLPIDGAKLTNKELHNYIRNIELKKQKKSLLKDRLEEEDVKINILNKNIEKLESANDVLELEATKVRGSTASLSGQITQLKMSLEKAQSESKIKKVKKLKSDILINAKILKSQEDSIKELKEKREFISREQEMQRSTLLEKRERIERLKNESVKNEFNNIDNDLIDIVEETMRSNMNKNQIMSSAMEDVSTEMERIKALEALNSARTSDNIQLLKTQMFNLNKINQESEETQAEKTLIELEDGALGMLPTKYKPANKKIKKKIKKARKSRNKRPFKRNKMKIMIVTSLISSQVIVVALIVLFAVGIISI